MKALYARQSLDKKDSLSIEGQIELCKTRLDEDTQYEVYEDKGFSGKNAERPALKKLLNDVKAGKIDTVIVYRLDRFSRNIVDFYNLYEVLKKNNCEFVSTTESFDTASPMGRAMMGILITFAQMERENIQQRVKDNYYYRITDGRWAGGPAPYGYRNGRTEDGKPTLIAIPEEIETVKLIFRLYYEEINISLGKIVNEITSRNMKSRRKNGKWDSSSVSKILQNTIYVKADSALYKYLEIRQIKFLNNESQWTGETSCHVVGKRVGNANIRKYTDFKEQSVYLTNIPGIIDSRIYISIMDRLAQNEQITSANKPSVLEELGGKLKCTCGYGIKSYSRSTTGRPYLDCYAHRTLHACNHRFTQFNFYDVQKYVGGQIQYQLDHIRDTLRRKREARRQIEKQINDLKHQLNNLVRMAAMSDIMAQAVKDQIESTQKRINELALQLDMHIDVVDRLEIPGFVGDAGKLVSRLDYSTMTLEQKKYIVNLMIDKIVLDEDDDAIHIYWKI